MKFDDCTNYYSSLTEALKDNRRQALYERNEDFLTMLETTLFDKYDVEEIFIVDEFFDRQKFDLTRLPLYWEMSKPKFESFVDAREADFLCEQFDLRVRVDSAVFHFNNIYWVSESDKIIKKEIWKK